MAEQETVLSFLGHTKVLPKKCTVERTSNSKYLFYLVVRHLRRRVKGHLLFFVYSKQSVNSVKAQIEEYSVWQEGGLYVLEGFSLSFVDDLELPPDTYVLAETDGGWLKADSYVFWKRRDILRVLQQQLRLTELSLRTLINLDWSSMQNYEDYEILLRKAKVMDWSAETIGAHLRSMGQGNVLTALKRSAFEEIFTTIENQGSHWMTWRIINQLGSLMLYRALKVMGYDEMRIVRELDTSTSKVKELEETSRMLTTEDIKLLAERLVKLDRLMERNPDLGLSLFLLNAPIQVKIR